MSTLLARNLHFIAWENFADPRVYGLWLLALAGLLITVYPPWLLGRIVTAGRRYDSATEELATGMTVGIGAAVVPMFLLASVGGYRPVPLTVLAILIAAVATWREGPGALAAPGSDA